MKKLFKLTFIALIGLAIGLSSCGKYPDGPKISLKTKTARITRVWTDAATPSGTIEFKKDGSVVISSGGLSLTGWTWKFSSDKKNIETTYVYGGVSTTGSDIILRLTSKDLWLQSTGSSTIDKYTAK